MRQRTFRVPLTHAGFVTLARKGMLLAVEIRETPLSGTAVRLIEVQSDMCGAWEETGR
jgi:hypothetical protein